MANDNSTSNISAVNSFFSKDLLKRNLAQLQYAKFADMSKDIPTKNSQTVKWRKYTALAAATTALTEGTTPSGTDIAASTPSATVEQFGAYVKHTDTLEITVEEPMLQEVSKLQAEQSAETFDELTRDVLIAGTSVSYSEGAVTASVSTGLTSTLIRAAVRTLANNNAKPIKEIMDGTPKIGTVPINASYIGIVHPNITYDLKTMTGFTKVEEYARKDDIMAGEVGKLDQVRFVETTKCYASTDGFASASVYRTVILGRDAYGISRIAGNALQTIIKPLGYGDDPLNQRATQGWKGYFVAKILNENNLTRIEHTVL